MERARRLGRSILAAGLCLAVGGVAHAERFTATYTGTLADGFDLTGMFGVPGADLTGAGYVATFTYDSALAGHHTTGIDSGGLYERAFGGSYDGTGNPMVDSSITVGGVTIDLRPRYFGEADVFFTDFAQEASEELGRSDGMESDSAIEALAHAPGGIPATVDATVPTEPAVLLGFFQIYVHLDATDDYPVLTYGDFDHAMGTFSVSVPEPGAWALMVAGFGGIGAAMRRRRAASVA
jgi:hypothetical protein